MTRKQLENHQREFIRIFTALDPSNREKALAILKNLQLSQEQTKQDESKGTKHISADIQPKGE